MLNYALRVNLTIAIVAMVEEPVSKPASKIPSNTAAAGTLPAAVLNKNDTFFHNSHSTEELSSAAHTLPISTTPEPFQNLTDKVSFWRCFPLFIRTSLMVSSQLERKMLYHTIPCPKKGTKYNETHRNETDAKVNKKKPAGRGQKPEFNALCKCE